MKQFASVQTCWKKNERKDVLVIYLRECACSTRTSAQHSAKTRSLFGGKKRDPLKRKFPGKTLHDITKALKSIAETRGENEDGYLPPPLSPACVSFASVVGIPTHPLEHAPKYATLFRSARGVDIHTVKKGVAPITLPLVCFLCVSYRSLLFPSLLLFLER